MDQVHVVRHKVLVEGQSVRRWRARWDLSRNTVKRYVEQAGAGAGGAGARGRPVSEKVGPRIEALLAESPRWTGGKQRLTATRLHAMLCAEGHTVGVTVGEGGGRGVEAPAPRGVRAAGVPAGRFGGGRLLRGARRARRQAAEGLDVRDAPDALGARLRVALHAPRPGELSRRARARVRALRLRAAAHRVRQSQGGRRQDPRRLRARARGALSRRSRRTTCSSRASADRAPVTTRAASSRAAKRSAGSTWCRFRAADDLGSDSRSAARAPRRRPSTSRSSAPSARSRSRCPERAFEARRTHTPSVSTALARQHRRRPLLGALRVGRPRCDRSRRRRRRRHRGPRPDACIMHAIASARGPSTTATTSASSPRSLRPSAGRRRAHARPRAELRRRVARARRRARTQAGGAHLRQGARATSRRAAPTTVARDARRRRSSEASRSCSRSRPPAPAVALVADDALPRSSARHRRRRRMRRRLRHAARSRWPVSRAAVAKDLVVAQTRVAQDARRSRASSRRSPARRARSTGATRNILHEALAAEIISRRDSAVRHVCARHASPR